MAMHGDIVEVESPHLTAETLKLLLTQPYVVTRNGKPLYEWTNPPTTMRVHVNDAGDTIPLMMNTLDSAGVTVTSLQEYRPPFDEVFIQLMGGTGSTPPAD